MAIIWKRVTESVGLLLLFFSVKLWEFREFLRVLWRYYPNSAFRRVDLGLLFVYFFRSPYRMSRRFLEVKGAKNIHAYGETPLSSLEALVQAAAITADDVVYELGCGRGRSCFWLHHFVGCEVVGVDFIPTFPRAGNWLVERYGIQGVSFREEDMAQVDYSGASVVYLYGTGFERGLLVRLTEALARLPDGAKVISVSYSLNDYCPVQRFRLKEVVPVQFNWGEGRVYIQEKGKPQTV